ncbi:MAG: hypothetical protein ACREHG_10595, partial [Candidatus Saccharimonadales bacterium]
VSDTSPATAYSARMAIANETLVSPASAAIALTGRTKDAVNRGGEFTHLVVPQEANVGDLAIVWLYSNSQPTFSQADATWTNLDSYTDSRGKTSVWYKILKAADIGVRTEWKINQTGKRWVAVMTTYSGVNQTTPINAHSHSTETTFQTGHTTPSVTTTSSNCWIQSAVFDTSSTTSVWTPPGTETLRQDVYCVGGNAATGIVTDNATAVATGAHTGSSFSSNVKSRFSSMSRVAIAPSTGTGPGSVAVTMGAWQFEQSASASAWVAAGHWKDLFKGLTDSWSKTWNGDLSLMEVQATDRSKQLSANNVGSAISETVLETLPQAYYQLGESGDTSTTEGANSALVPQDGIKALQVGTGGTLEWGSGVGPPIDGQAAVITTNVDRTDGLMLTVSLANPIVDASEITLMGWYTSSDAVAAYGTLFKLISLGAGVSQVGFVELGIHPGTPQMRAYGYIKSEITTFETTATVGTNYNDGKTHFIVDVVTLDGGNLTSTLYVDGVQKATDSVACTFTTFPPITVINVGGNTAGTSPNQLMSATFSHAAAVPFAVDADTIANIYTAGTTAFAGDTVDQRIGRIGDWANIEDLNLDASMTICGRHMPDTQSVLNAIQQAARTDGGTSFVDDDGSVTFLSRERKEATASPWLTVDAGEVDVNTSEITDDQLLVNQATIKRLGANSTQISSDLASQVLHGIYDKDVDTIQQDVDDAKYNGQYLTAFYAEPTQRCDSITIEALFLNQWDVLLTQEMWNIIEITGLPSIEESTTLDLYVEGWSYSIDDKSWQITYDTSAAIQFAILNDSARDVVGTVVVAW